MICMVNSNANNTYILLKCIKGLNFHFWSPNAHHIHVQSRYWLDLWCFQTREWTTFVLPQWEMGSFSVLLLWSNSWGAAELMVLGLSLTVQPLSPTSHSFQFCYPSDMKTDRQTHRQKARHRDREKDSRTWNLIRVYQLSWIW